MIDRAEPHSYPPRDLNGSGGDPAGRHGRNGHGPVPRRTPRRTAGDGGLDWRSLLRSFQRRWLLAMALGLTLGGAAATAAWFLIPAPYVASRELYIKSFDDQRLFETSESQASFDTRKETSQKLVTSIDVLEAAVRDGDLTRTATLAGEEDAEAWLQQHLAVSGAGKEFFRISLAGERPKDLALIVNAVTDAFMKVVVEGEITKRQERLKGLQDSRGVVESELKRKRDDLKELIARTNSATPVMFEQKQENLLALHLALRQQLGQVQLDLIKARVARGVRDGLAGQDDLEIPDPVIDAYVMQDPEYQKSAGWVEQLRNALDGMGNLSAGHPRIAEAKRKLADGEAKHAALREQLRPKIVERLIQGHKAETAASQRELADQVTALEMTKEGIEKEIEGIKVREKDIGVRSFELETIDQEIERRAGMLATLDGEIDRRIFELKDPVLPIASQQKAEPPAARDQKRRLAGTGGAGLGVFGLVVAGIVLLDSRVRRISTVDQVSGELSMRLIGSIPSMPRFAMNADPKARRPRAKVLFWQNAIKESIDAARTVLLREAERGSLQVLMISSAVAGEGKTTLACHLSASLARSGRRVVLVDCDLRHPSVDRVFPIDGDAGACEVLRGEATLDEVIRPTLVSGLFVVAAGEVCPAALEGLTSRRLEAVLARLRQGYDFVVLDASPALPICDALLVAQHADAVMLAVRADVSRLSQVAAATHRFTSVGVPVLGAVAIGLADDPVGYGTYYRDHRRYLTGHRVNGN